MVVFQSDLSCLMVSAEHPVVIIKARTARILVIYNNYSTEKTFVNLEYGGISWQNLVSRWPTV